MEHKILIAGFGGQGVLFAGKIIAQAAVNCGLETTFLPSYGPEMRGGTANCRVVVSDKYISSPYFSRCDSLIAMNNSSYNKFAAIADKTVYTNIAKDNTVYIDAGEYGKQTNIVMLGAFLKQSNILPKEAIIEILKTKKASETNIAAFEYGYNLI